ncbi:PREDICTED: proline-rich transmembrane protein 1-like isoform X2 [Priapulus caudatus]|uniref:Proline-rich transmembrane protein 1-like isoform X2 n=1 Tax=Priapulus caudatus TaxID=37621 RepID=A0ABM1FC10_PRICU|nr:PREDICTED: proline-rich transmembrane protein 1-like isoform X2 [Priapulus caudatus]
MADRSNDVQSPPSAPMESPAPPSYDEAMGQQGYPLAGTRHTGGELPPSYETVALMDHNVEGHIYRPQPAGQVYPTNGQPVGACSNSLVCDPLGSVSPAGYPVRPGEGGPYSHYMFGGMKYANGRGMPSSGQYPPQIGGDASYVLPPVVSQRQIPSSSGVVVERVDANPPDYLCKSVFACLCCFWPCGIIAIIYSLRVRSLNSQHRYEEAWKASRITRNTITACIVIGLALYILKLGLTSALSQEIDESAVNSTMVDWLTSNQTGY